MRIFLIGMPGSGKSTLGKQLASELGIAFADLDERIEEMTQKTVSEIFNQQGEDHFRKLERDALYALKDEGDAVIACGGGTPCFFDNMKWMKSNGETVYLKISLDELQQRLENDSTRPLLKNNKNMNVLEGLYETRKSIYEQAKFSVSDYNQLKSIFIVE